MDGAIWRLTTALSAFAVHRTPAKIRSALNSSGPAELIRHVSSLPTSEQDSIAESAAELESRGIDAHLIGTDGYPSALRSIPSAPPILFTLGNRELLEAPSVGMCGSRHTSEQGLRAAMVCGEDVARHGLTIVSGYAKGVDTQTHIAALQDGGSTIIVLAEGINHFRKKRDFGTTGLPMDRVLVVSQFEPGRPWSVGGAMTRNGVIAGLSKALVVIEAGERGGTLDAGLRAIELGRPVIALQFESMATPPGNQLLFDRGAVPVRTRKELLQALDAIDESVRSPEPLQLRLG
ncbi:MAG: DNA-processing protein DprA [Acidimicrobiales bacterium]